MLSKRWQRVTWRLPLPPTPPELSHRHWHTVGLQGMETCEQKCSGASVTIPSELLCRCGESQQRWNQWLWLAHWSWASSPAGSMWLHTGFHRCLSQGRSKGNSSHRTHFKKPKHRNNSAETRQLQKKLQNGGDTDLGSFLFVLEGWVSPDLHGWAATPLH